MISSQNNNGKTWSGDSERLRLEAERDKDKFTADELSFLNFTQNGIIGKLDQWRETMNVGTRPVDILDDERDYDWRETPEVGY
jgi:hypothetical protein